MALAGFAAPAQAADLSVDSFKDPLPDKISYAGVTFYGTVDVGYGYQQHGYSYTGFWGNALNYQPNDTNALSSKSQLINNALSQSSVGVKVEEGLGYGFVGIAKLETGFNPLTGELANGQKSLQQNGKVWDGVNKLLPQNPNLPAASDSARAGQFLNGDAYAGISNATYGTLTFGRQSSFLTDAVGAYDPNRGSTAFSLIGNTGTIVQGAGDTEAARWDNSVKYIYQFGPVHAGVQYSNGGDGTSLLGSGVGANAGFTYKGLSVDGYYTKENGAVSLDGVTALNTNSFVYTVSNNEAFGITGKYVYDLGGGYKDGPSSKVTFFGGYVRVDLTNPDKDQSLYNKNQTIGGYNLVQPGTSVAFATDKVLQTGWVGASYETGPWTYSGGWYHENQNDYLYKKVGSTANSTKAGGDVDWVSGVVDYKFNKHFDVYAGVSWVDFTGNWTKSAGVQNGTTSDVNVATGLRLKF